MLAATSHQQGWDMAQTEHQLNTLIEKNYDLRDADAIATAKGEFRTMADPKLNGWLPKIYELATERMQLEVAGSTKRLNHEMMKFCRRVIKSTTSQVAVIQEIQAEITGMRK